MSAAVDRAEEGAFEFALDDVAVRERLGVAEPAPRKRRR